MALLDNLIAAWELDEASGNAIDSHSTHDLTETSGTIAAAAGPGGVGGSRDFEEADTERFQANDHADLSTGDVDFTLEAWVNLESVDAETFLSKWTIGGNQREYQLRYDSGEDRFEFTVSSTGADTVTLLAEAFGAVSLGTWYQVIVWHDSVNDEIGIAINAGTPDTLSHSAGVFDSTATFAIGGRSSVTSDAFDGLIAKVRLWKRVLTSQERTDLYNGGTGLAYADFDEGGGGGSIVPIIQYHRLQQLRRRCG